jgi:catechol 2,3-dioxygenase-like lactoylglutathione lyase family enzyme
MLTDVGATNRNVVSIRPSFIVQDLQASLHYYVERFGFQLDFQGPDGGPLWGQVSRDEAAIIFKSVASDVPPVPNHTRHEWARWDAYIYTLDPDALFAEFRHRGVSFWKELSFIDDGLWGFEVTDADGYVIAFFRSDDDQRRAVVKSGNLVSISPFFIAKDLQASLDYYIERFGFQLDFTGPEGGVFYAQVSRDGTAIFLKAISREVLPAPNHTRHEWAPWDAYLYTLDPDALFAEFRQRGASFRKELGFIEPGLWGFTVTDADGYLLAFFQLRDG